VSPREAPESDLGPGLLISVWRYKWYVVLVVLLAAAAALGHANAQPRIYEAESTLLLSDPNRPSVIGDSRPSNVQPFTYASTQAVVVQSSPVVAKANELLASPVTFDELEDVTVEPVPDVLLLVIRVRHTDPQRAAALADALPTAYEQVAAAQLSDATQRTLAELATARSELEGVIADLDRRLAEATSRGTQSEVIALQSERFSVAAEVSDVAANTRRVAIDSALFGSGVEQREDAVLSPGPVSPRPLRDTALAGLLGLLLASGAAWAVNTRRASKDERRGPEKILGAPLVGEIPELADRDGALVPAFAQPQSEEAEAFRFLAAAVTLRLPGSGRAVLVTSAGDGEGKTVTSLNVALALAQPGRSVVLLDASPRADGIRPLLGTLSGGVFDQTAPQADGGYQWTPQDRQVSLRVVGLPVEAEQSSGASEVLERLRASADIVVIDAPALFRVAAVTELASQVDGVLLVVTPQTVEPVLEEVRRQLDLAGSPIMGYVRNRVRRRAGAGQDSEPTEGPPLIRPAGVGSARINEATQESGATENSNRKRMRASGANTAGP
jgi:Mrp family chromosome partitioning ATPase